MKNLNLILITVISMLILTSCSKEQNELNRVKAFESAVYEGVFHTYTDGTSNATCQFQVDHENERYHVRIIDQSDKVLLNATFTPKGITLGHLDVQQTAKEFQYNVEYGYFIGTKK